MRVLFTFTHLNFWQPIDPMARQYCADGHQVRLLLDRVRNKKFVGRIPISPENAPYEMGWMSGRRDAWQLVLPSLRELISYIAYLRIRQPTSPLLIERWAGYVFFPLRLLTRFGWFKRWLSRDSIWKALHRVEPVAPPSRALIKEISRYNPDVLVAASAILPFSRELEYLKAARQLGIPTIVIIPSWDNLTTKGTLQIIPDWVVVWNKWQVDEAVKLHDVPEQRIFCAGAPRYDQWFDMRPTIDHDSFCQQMGVDPDHQFLLYLCSSEFIAGDETEFVEQLAASLAQSPITKLRDITILVRPHPLNLGIWDAYQPRHRNIVVWPKNLSVFDPLQTNQDFYHSLRFSSAVVGVNTSAFIEAAVVDKPSIAIASDYYRMTQLGIPHFKYLLEGDFLELPGDFQETANVIAEVLNGKDHKKLKRRQFVRDFIRPHGINIPATQVMVRAIDNIAAGRPPGA